MIIEGVAEDRVWTWSGTNGYEPLRNAVLVSRTWFSIGVPHLWSEMKDLLPIFQLIGGVVLADSVRMGLWRVSVSREPL